MKAHNPPYVEGPHFSSNKPILRYQSVQICMFNLHVPCVFCALKDGALGLFHDPSRKNSRKQIHPLSQRPNRKKTVGGLHIDRWENKRFKLLWIRVQDG